MNLSHRLHVDPAARARLLRYVFWFLAASLLFNLIFGDMGIVEGLRERALACRLRGEVATLRAENDALATDIRALHTDPFRVESIAREQLGLARPGEIIFLFTADGTAPAAGDRPSLSAAPASAPSDRRN